MLRYNVNLKDRARELRKNLTDSERALWSRLRGKQLMGVQFYRQKPLGNFIVDFFAPRKKLVIEIDGSQHMQGDYLEKDKRRDEYLARLGLRVLRFNSRVVLEETDAVMESILGAMKDQLGSEIPPRPPLRKGGK